MISTNLYDQDRKMATQLAEEMSQLYENLGKLPASLVVKTAQDNSHLEYVARKKRDSNKAQ